MEAAFRDDDLHRYWNGQWEVEGILRVSSVGARREGKGKGRRGGKEGQKGPCTASPYRGSEVIDDHLYIVLQVYSSEKTCEGARVKTQRRRRRTYTVAINMID